VTGLSCRPDRLRVRDDTLAPARVPDLFPGAPLVLAGRYHGSPSGAMRVRGTAADGTAWQTRVEAATVDNPALAAVWARAHLRDLEDRYLTVAGTATAELERRIVATSLRFSVLCRFTAYVATDTRSVTDGQPVHRVVQPVEPVAGWELAAGPPPGVPAPAPGGLRVMAMGAPESAAAGGVSRMLRPARGPRTPRPVPQPAPVPVADLAVEAARLRTAAGAPEPERRTLLADLASRLAALLQVRHPDSAGAGGGPLARLRALLAELAGDTVLRVSAGELDRLWHRMQELLDELAGAGEGSGSRPPTEPPRRRGDFWRRSD
jgi:Ca-activated chloride channel family protein